MTNGLNPKQIFPRLMGALIIYRTIAEGIWRNVSRGWKMLTGVEDQQNTQTSAQRS